MHSFGMYANYNNISPAKLSIIKTTRLPPIKNHGTVYFNYRTNK